MIVGGGQIGAEELFSLLQDQDALPDEIIWVSSKGYPVCLDENPFANDLYTPSFSNSFFDLSAEQRSRYNAMLRDTSDGIQSNLLERVYQRLFFLTEVKRLPLKLSFVPVSKIAKVEEDAASKTFTASTVGFCNSDIPSLDQIILCTGFIQNDLTLLQGLGNYCDAGVTVREDFSIQPSCETSCRVFVHNGAKSFFGPADPNLSLISWRSAKIINSIAGEEIYKLRDDFSSMINWVFTPPEDMASNPTI